MPFAEVLDAIDELSFDEQETLVGILSRRLIHQGRTRLIDEVRAARKESAEGSLKVVTVEELMAEIQS